MNGCSIQRPFHTSLHVDVIVHICHELKCLSLHANRFHSWLLRGRIEIKMQRAVKFDAEVRAPAKRPGIETRKSKTAASALSGPLLSNILGCFLEELCFMCDIPLGILRGQISLCPIPRYLRRNLGLTLEVMLGEGS